MPMLATRPMTRSGSRAKQVRRKVIGEGANLGLTQRARIEFSKRGGRCNSDAIDNSAGVNSSDVEVNIKIALTPPLTAASLRMPASATSCWKHDGEVAELVLRNNYQQTLRCRCERRGMEAVLSNQARLMADLEARDCSTGGGRPCRTISCLPSAGSRRSR